MGLGFIKIYQSDGVTPNDSEISDLWQWNSTANQFELEVIIKNTGTNDVTITFSHTAPSGWVVNYSGVTTIVKGGSETASSRLYHLQLSQALE